MSTQDYSNGDVAHTDDLADQLNPEEIHDEFGTHPVQVGDQAIAAHQLAEDLNDGHAELTEYKEGALSYCDALDEEVVAALNRGETHLANELEELRESAWAMYQRLSSGDKAFNADDEDPPALTDFTVTD